MSTTNRSATAIETNVEVLPIGPSENIVDDAGNHLCVLTVSDPKDSRKTISNVECRYRIAGSEIYFNKPNYDAHETPEDALSWAKSCASRLGIETVYTLDRRTA